MLSFLSLSLKSFSNLWCNSNIKFLVIIIYCHFTCDEGKISQEVKKCQHILWRVIGSCREHGFCSNISAISSEILLSVLTIPSQTQIVRFTYFVDDLAVIFQLTHGCLIRLKFTLVLLCAPSCFQKAPIYFIQFCLSSL